MFPKHFPVDHIHSTKNKVVSLWSLGRLGVQKGREKPSVTPQALKSEISLVA